MFDDDLDCGDDFEDCLDDGDELDVGALPLPGSIPGIGGSAARPPVRGSVKVTAPVARAPGVSARGPLQAPSAAMFRGAAHEVMARAHATRMGGLDANHLQLARQTVKIPGIQEAVKLLRTAHNQRTATSEHNARMADAAFRRDVKARLAKIENLLGGSVAGQHVLRIIIGRRKAGT